MRFLHGHRLLLGQGTPEIQMMEPSCGTAVVEPLSDVCSAISSVEHLQKPLEQNFAERDDTTEKSVQRAVEAVQRFSEPNDTPKDDTLVVAPTLESRVRTCRDSQSVLNPAAASAMLGNRIRQMTEELESRVLENGWLSTTSATRTPPASNVAKLPQPRAASLLAEVASSCWSNSIKAYDPTGTPFPLRPTGRARRELLEGRRRLLLSRPVVPDVPKLDWKAARFDAKTWFKDFEGGLSKESLPVYKFGDHVDVWSLALDMKTDTSLMRAVKSVVRASGLPSWRYAVKKKAILEHVEILRLWCVDRGPFKTVRQTAIVAREAWEAASSLRPEGASAERRAWQELVGLFLAIAPQSVSTFLEMTPLHQLLNMPFEGVLSHAIEAEEAQQMYGTFEVVLMSRQKGDRKEDDGLECANTSTADMKEYPRKEMKYCPRPMACSGVLLRQRTVRGNN